MYQSSCVIPQSNLSDIRRAALATNFAPQGTMRCSGTPMFRTPEARDLGCLLDLDPEVQEWTCLPLRLTHGQSEFIPDFLARTAGGTLVIHSGPAPGWISSAAYAAGFEYQFDRYDLHAQVSRLANARDLLRYASYNVSLGDRVRILALLDEYGSMPLSHCTDVIKNSGDAVGTIAALVLQRILELDLDDGPIGPTTRIRAA